MKGRDHGQCIGCGVEAIPLDEAMDDQTAATLVEHELSDYHWDFMMGKSLVLPLNARKKYSGLQLSWYTSRSTSESPEIEGSVSNVQQLAHEPG